MGYFLTILCTAVCLLYLSAAYPKGPYGEVLGVIRNLTSDNQMELCVKVDALDNTTNLSVAEVSCRARKSLEKACKIRNAHLERLKKYLSKFHNGVQCTVSGDREEDIHSFLKNIFLYFQKQNFNYKSKVISSTTNM